MTQKFDGKIWDVAVLGLGAMGSAAAASLAGRGLSVLGLEQFQPVHDLGSSHGETRIIRQAYFESPVYVPLVQQCYTMWRELERRTGSQLMVPCGALILGPPGSEAYQGSLKSVRTHHLNHEILDTAGIRQRFPAMNPPQEIGAVYEPDAGLLRVEQCIAALQARAQEQGAHLEYHTAVATWQDHGDQVTIATLKAQYRSKKLVLTAGAWSPQLLQCNLPLTVERVVMHWFQPAENRAAFLPQHFPVHLWDLQDGCQFYGLPTLPDSPIGMKLAFHQKRTAACADSVQRQVSKRETETLWQYARSLLPGLKGHHTQSKVCLYTSTPDGHFVIGHHPHSSNAVIACGFSGHGFKFAPIVGEILADLATGDHTAHPIKPFSPTRFTHP